MNQAAYMRELAVLRDSFSTDAERRAFDVRVIAMERKPVVSFGVSLFLGELGLDRFRLNHWARGVAKLALNVVIPVIAFVVAVGLLNAGGLLAEAGDSLNSRDVQAARTVMAAPPLAATGAIGVGALIAGNLWALLDLFLIGSATRHRNLRQANAIADSVRAV